MAAGVKGPLGIVAAMDWEMDAFASCPGRDRLVLETTGPGAAAAASGAEHAVSRGACCLVSWGTAGGLGKCEPGEIVLAERVRDDSSQSFSTDTMLVETLARAFRQVAIVHRGILASASAPVTSVAAKRSLAESSGAIAVDMESAAIADIAARAEIPFVVVRVIVDRADRNVPSAALAGMDGRRTRPGRVLASLVRSPRQTGDLISLGLAARRARQTLGACAPVLASLCDR